MVVRGLAYVLNYLCRREVLLLSEGPKEARERANHIG